MNNPITSILFSKKKNILLLCVLMTIRLHGQDLSEDCTWTVYTFPNGNKSSEGCLIGGVPDGVWTSYHENGKIKSEGARENSIVTGSWNFYDTTGIKIKSVEFFGGKKNGWEREFYPKSDGIVERETQFMNDEKSGWEHSYDEMGKLTKSIPFEKNLSHGVGKEYGDDGRIVTLLNFHKGYMRSKKSINQRDINNQKTGVWMVWNVHDILIEEGNWLNGMEHGLFKFYDGWGQLDRVEKYFHGELVVDSEETTPVDVRRTFHENGVVATVSTFANNQRVGVSRIYDLQGVLIAGEVYDQDVKVADGITDEAGMRMGEWKHYYESGELKSEGGYLEGKMEGLWKFYAPKGELIQTGTFRQGLFHGEWIWYYLNGQLHRKEHYRTGKEHGMFEEWDAAGKLILSGHYESGLKQGEWFVDVNDHREQGKFIDGERNGEWIHTFPDGIEQFKGSYELGLPTDKHVYRNADGSLLRVERYNLGEKSGRWMIYGPDQFLQQTLDYKNGELWKVDGQRVQEKEKKEAP